MTNSLATPAPKDEAITLEFPFRAVSFQQARFGKGRVFKTKKQAEFEKKILDILKFRLCSMHQFKEAFDPSIHVILSDWSFIYSDFFTKKDESVSSRCLDLDNSIKNIQDIIFKCMGIDDKYITGTVLYKWKGPEDKIKCTFKLMKRDKFTRLLKEFENKRIIELDD